MSKVPEMLVTRRLSKTRAATLDRHAEWWEMRRQGYTTYTIAAKFGVSQQAVSEAMLKMEQKLYDVLAEQASPMKAAQTEALQANMERALVEWERSKSLDDDRAGDPRFLAEFRNNLAEIRKIWGLDAPAKQTTEVSGPGGGAIAVAFTDALARIYGDDTDSDKSESSD